MHKTESAIIPFEPLNHHLHHLKVETSTGERIWCQNGDLRRMERSIYRPTDLRLRFIHHQLPTMKKRNTENHKTLFWSNSLWCLFARPMENTNYTFGPVPGSIRLVCRDLENHFKKLTGTLRSAPLHCTTITAVSKLNHHIFISGETEKPREFSLSCHVSEVSTPSEEPFENRWKSNDTSGKNPTLTDCALLMTEESYNVTRVISILRKAEQDSFQPSGG